MRPDVVFAIFMATWIVLGVAGFLLFHVNRYTRFEKKRFPWYMSPAGVLLIAFAILIEAPLEVFFFMVPALALIIFLNIRGTSFCENCGRTIYNHMFFSKAEYCAKCGARLDD